MQCEYVKEGKGKCKGYAMQESNYCFVHNPKTRLEHQKATQKGGSVSHNDLELAKPLDIEKPAAVISLLLDTINRVRKIKEDGSMDTKTATCVGFLASKLIEARKNQLEEPEDAVAREKWEGEAKFREKYQRAYELDPIRVLKREFQMIQGSIRYEEDQLRIKGNSIKTPS